MGSAVHIVTIQSIETDRYVCAEQGGDALGVVVCDRRLAGPWETFQAIDANGGRWAFQSANHRYLVAEPDGAIRCNRTVIGPWEQFTIAGDQLIDWQGRPVTIGGQSHFRFHGLDSRPGLIRVWGSQFIDHAGATWVMRGMTAFRDYERFLRGDDLAPVLLEARSLGANTRRVLLMAEYVARFHPQDHGAQFYEALPDLLALYAAHNLYAELVVFADAQIIMPDLGQQREHLAEVVRRTSESPNTFYELANEAVKNGIDPLRFDRPNTTAPCSRGSDLSDGIPPKPTWDYVTHHNARGAEWFVHGTDVLWFQRLGYGGGGLDRPMVYNEPIGAAESSVPGRRSDRPDEFEIFARTSIAAGVAGVTFHSDDGIQSQPLGPMQRRCAEAFFRGLNASRS